MTVTAQTAPMPAAVNLMRTLAARAGLDPAYRKVFCIGFNKTGTTSIDAIFRAAGMASIHTTYWSRPGPHLCQFTHQAFCDGNPLGFRALDRRFPRSRFILNTRNLDEWLDSRIEHIRAQQARGLHRETKHWRIADEAVIHWVRTRNAHHLDVLDYFGGGPENLLVVNYIRDPDAAGRIARFIGRPELAESEKPYVRPIPRTREQGALRNAAMIGRCLDSLGIPESERGADIHCPSLGTGTTAPGAAQPWDTLAA
ncbi:MAG: hypothetical protein AAF577_14630 [Pseudomonadota bacterium]